MTAAMTLQHFGAPAQGNHKFNSSFQVSGPSQNSMIGTSQQLSNKRMELYMSQAQGRNNINQESGASQLQNYSSEPEEVNQEEQNFDEDSESNNEEGGDFDDYGTEVAHENMNIGTSM